MQQSSTLKAWLAMGENAIDMAESAPGDLEDEDAAPGPATDPLEQADPGGNCRILQSDCLSPGRICQNSAHCWLQ